MLYLSVGEAVERTGASASSVRAWVRTGQVRTRQGSGARGDRLEVALADVEAVLARRAAAEAPRAPAERDAGEGAIALPAVPDAPGEPAPRRRRTAARPARPARATPPAAEDEPVPGRELVPMQTVEAMERLSGELYLAGQRAARAEAVAELRERRLADLQQEVEDLQREATALWEQNQELLRRVALAEAQLEARVPAPAAAASSLFRLRR